MPMLRQRQQALSTELQAIADQTNDRAAFLRLAETLTAFLARLYSAAETLNVIEPQKIVRLLVKDVLVGEDTITIRHSIPIPSDSSQNAESGSSDGTNYLLCKGRDDTTLWSALVTWDQLAVFLLHWRLQPALNVENHPFLLRVFL